MLRAGESKDGSVDVSDLLFFIIFIFLLPPQLKLVGRMFV